MNQKVIKLYDENKNVEMTDFKVGYNRYLFDGQKSTFFPRGKTRVLLSPEGFSPRET